MANNTEDVELRDRLKSILDNFYYTIDEDMGQADDTAIYSLSALVQQEANRQKLELLDRLEAGLSPRIDTRSRIGIYAGDEGQMWYDRGQNHTVERTISAIEAERNVIQAKGGAMTNQPDTNQASEDELMGKDADLREKLTIRVGVLHKTTPCEAITARLVVDTILPTIQQEIAKARLNEVQNAYEYWINGRNFISSYFRDRIAQLSNTKEANQ